MKKLMLPIIIVLLASLGLFFAGCDNNGNGDGLDTLLKIVQDNPDLASLAVVIAYIDQYSSFDPEVANGLNDDSETFTLFGPNNDAFVAVLGDANVDGVVSYADIRNTLGGTDIDNANDLLFVLGYHAIVGQTLDTTEIAAQDGSTIGPTESDTNEMLNVTVVGLDINLDPADGTSGATIVTADSDVEASNGIGHVIDAVMGLTP